MGVRYSNLEGYSLSVAAWLTSDSYNHMPVKGPYISVTGLLKPIRMIVLDQRIKAVKQDNSVDEVIDISRFVPSRLGTAIHAGIESAWHSDFRKGLTKLNYPKKLLARIRVNPTPEELLADPSIIAVYMELRAFKEVLGWTVGGMFDFIGDGTLEDFKTMGVYGYMMGGKDHDQMMQGSMYKWLNPEIITSNHMLIQQIFTDWSKLDAGIKAKRGYPSQRIVAKRLELMTVEETDTWVTNRIQEIQSLMDVPEPELPYCTKKELWQDEPSYKYYKNPLSTGRSTKNYNTMDEALCRKSADGDVGLIKEFPAKVKRCGYCDAYDLCTQKDAYIDAGILQLP